MKHKTAVKFNQSKCLTVSLKCCAQCDSDDIFEFDGDVFCNSCGWNTIEVRVESQLAFQIFSHQVSALRIVPAGAGSLGAFVPSLRFCRAWLARAA